MKAKVIKLTESDIANLIIKIMQEGKSLDEYIQSSPDVQTATGGSDVDVDADAPGVQVELTLAQNPENNDVYILKNAFTDEPEILGVVKNAQF